MSIEQEGENELKIVVDKDKIITIGKKDIVTSVALGPYRHLGRPCLHRYHRLVARIGSKSPLIHPFRMSTCKLPCFYTVKYQYTIQSVTLCRSKHVSRLESELTRVYTRILARSCGPPLVLAGRKSPRFDVVFLSNQSEIDRHQRAKTAQVFEQTVCIVSFSS